jgi:glutamyl-tRNA reductase
LPKELYVVGANHKTAGIHLRDRLAIPRASLLQALQALKDLPGTKEACLLSTCNRMEVYAAGEGPEPLFHFFSRFLKVTPEELAGHLYVKKGEDCVRHLFSVAAGTDSMVLGDAQILGQVRDAFLVSRQMEAVGPDLDLLFRKALETGKRVRTETEICSKAASISYAAVTLAKKTLSDLPNSLVLVIGVGQVGRLVAEILADKGVHRFLFANRSRERGEELARQYQGKAIPLSRLPQALAQVDIVISCTDAPHLIVRREMVLPALAQRQGRPLLFIDLAVPRDIDPTLEGTEGILLFNIDHLQQVATAGLRARRRELAKAKAIVAEECSKFMNQWHSRQVAPFISSLLERAEAVRQSELERVQGKLGQLSERQWETVKALTKAIVNKLLHTPISNLKEGSMNGQGQLYGEALAHLFDLSAEGKPNTRHPSSKTTAGSHQPGHEPSTQSESPSPLSKDRPRARKNVPIDR